jgi:hypothetical protein
VTSPAREAIEAEFDSLGGVAALTAWAGKNPNEFYTRIWPKLLPLQISSDPENPLIPSGEPKPIGDSTQEWLRKVIELSTPSPQTGSEFATGISTAQFSRGWDSEVLRRGKPSEFPQNFKPIRYSAVAGGTNAFGLANRRDPGRNQAVITALMR